MPLVAGAVLGFAAGAFGGVQSDWITDPAEKPFADARVLADVVPWGGVRIGGDVWFMREEIVGFSPQGLRLWKASDVEGEGQKVIETRFEDPELVALDDRLILFDRSYDASFGKTVGKVFAYFPEATEPVLLRSGVVWGNPIRFGNQVLFQGRPEIPGDPDFYSGNEPWVTDGTSGGTRLLKALAVTDYPAVSGNNFTQGFGRPVLAEDGSGVFFESGDLDRDGNPYNQGAGYPSQETRYVAFTNGTTSGTRRLALVSYHNGAYGPMVPHGDGVFYPDLWYAPFLRCVWTRRGGASWNPSHSGLGTTVTNSTIGGEYLGKSGEHLWFKLYNQLDPDSSCYGYVQANGTTPVIVPGLPGGTWRNAKVKPCPDGSAAALFYDSSLGQYSLQRGGADGWTQVAVVQARGSLLGCLAGGALFGRADGALVRVDMGSGQEEVLVQFGGDFSWISWSLKSAFKDEALLVSNSRGEAWITDGTVRGTLPWFEGNVPSQAEFDHWDGRSLLPGQDEVLVSPARAVMRDSLRGGGTPEIEIDLAWHLHRAPDWVEWRPLPGTVPDVAAAVYSNGLEWTGSALRWTPGGPGALRVRIPLSPAPSDSDIRWGGEVAWSFDGREVTGGTEQAVLYAGTSGSLKYERWRSESFGDSAATGAGPEEDPHGDGVENLLKFAFNMDAGGPDRSVLVPGEGSSGLPTFGLSEVDGETVFQVEFVRRRDSGLVYTPKHSPDLSSFHPMMGAEQVEPIDGEWERVIVREPCDPAVTPRCFGVVEVTLPE